METVNISVSAVITIRWLEWEMRVREPAQLYIKASLEYISLQHSSSFVQSVGEINFTTE